MFEEEKPIHQNTSKPKPKPTKKADKNENASNLVKSQHKFDMKGFFTKKWWNKECSLLLNHNNIENRGDFGNKIIKKNV